MKKGKRLYVNITNSCTTNCPFCCMYSGTENKDFMSFDVYKSIIDSCDVLFELQLEGGEPTLHKDLLLFMEYAASTGRLTKVILLTNGNRLEEFAKKIRDFSLWHDIPVEIKVSVNYWLISKNPKHLAIVEKVHFSTKYIPNFKLTLNVRKRAQGDDWIEEELEKLDLLDISTVFYFQSYGKLTGNTGYSSPVIVQNIEQWSIYSTDGTCFGQDLVKRSEYEHDKIQQN